MLQPKVVFQELNHVLEILKFHIQRQIPYLKKSFVYSKTRLKRPLKKKTKQWFSRPIIA